MLIVSGNSVSDVILFWCQLGKSMAKSTRTSFQKEYGFTFSITTGNLNFASKSKDFSNTGLRLSLALVQG